ncbi:MAG: biotin--[acetyl-CoA-carboxylase] ligase [Promethearchaeota archaeon]
MASKLNVSLRKLITKILLTRLVYFEETESTNEAAKALVLQGEDEGLLVISERQLGGRGRHGRKWESPSGGIYLSIVLRPRISNEFAPLMGLMVANATIGGINKAIEFRKGSSVNVRLKWPNDLMVEGRKLGGILGELVVREDGSLMTIIGVGLNNDFSLDELPEELQDTATTLYRESGVTIQPAALVAQIVYCIDFRLQEIERIGSFIATLDEFRRNCVTLGREVTIGLDAETVTGTAIDIDENGSLVVESEERIHIISAGEVIHLR